MSNQVQRIRANCAQVLRQRACVGTGIGCNGGVRKCHGVGVKVPRQSPAQQDRFTAALPQTMHIDNDRTHRISPKLSDSMTVRLVLEETISAASAPETQRYCTCSE